MVGKVRKGVYGKYQGMEYRIIVDMDHNIEVMTKDKGKIDNTFHDDNSGLYTKRIDPYGLKDCVSITSYGIIQDEKVRVLQKRK
ncbi:hypothetical protein WMZ97_06080 [Lentibacillus sp. N15]|uniref:hypothetical protein n=1 Tax=Lentibacillus songyuanensis TaxID=3136161 RepID=UPI0031B9C98C